MRIFILILIFSLIPFSLFAQDETGRNTGKIENESLDLGLNAGFGISQLASGIMVDGENKVRMNYEVSFRGVYFFSNHLGILFDLGNHFFRTREESNISSYYREYDLQYLYLNFSPIFSFKKIYLYLGVYIGFIVKASHEDSSSTDTSIDLYTVPDFGLCYGVGYTFDLSKKIKMMVGIELKNQINNFKKTGSSASKIFSAFINIGLLFNVK